jgi:hypothetical protein
MCKNKFEVAEITAGGLRMLRSNVRTGTCIFKKCFYAFSELNFIPTLPLPPRKTRDSAPLFRPGELRSMSIRSKMRRHNIENIFPFIITSW